jgi:hypothetical protein
MTGTLLPTHSRIHRDQRLPRRARLADEVTRRHLADWITVLWLVACMACALVAMTRGIILHDVMTLTLSATAFIALASVIGSCSRERETAPPR